MIKNRNCDFTPAFEMPVAASDPATARNLKKGMIYYNSVSGKIRKYSGSVWANLEGDDELDSKVITCRLSDISGANSGFVVSPFAGTLSKIYTVIHGVITTADAVLTSKIVGGSDITNKITIAHSGSAAGVVDSCDPDDNHTVAVGDALQITSDGGSDTSCEATVVFVITL